MVSAMSNEDIENLGPLAVLAGEWEGDKGADVAPAVPDRGVAKTSFRERISFTPIGRVDNHEQVLYGLRYSTTAWPQGADAPFHEEVGYWLWDAEREQVMRCFIVPRGVSVIAGGTAQADARSFSLEARVGSETYGICSNRFLDEQFKTESYRLKVTIHDEGLLVATSREQREQGQGASHGSPREHCHCRGQCGGCPELIARGTMPTPGGGPCPPSTRS